MKKTRTQLLMSALSLLLCFSMLMGTTLAWFTDEVTSAGNKIQAGNLKVDLEILDKETGEWSSLKDSQDPIFNYDRWEPGYTDTKILKIENEGTLALKWVAKFYSEQQLSILADVIDVYVCPSESELDYPTDRALEGYTCVGNLRTFINSIEDTTYGSLEAGKAAYLGIALKMREDANNDYQELSLGGTFDIRIFATQQTSEFDSFNNIYDILADESIVAADSKVLADGEPAIDYSLTAESTTVANVNIPADAILDPTQPVTVVFDGIDPEKTIELGENTKAFAFDITVTNLKEDLADDQLITIVVAAPKGLPELKAYHNGVLIPDAVYDEVAGTITFKTSSFSPYAFTYDEVEASSLEELREQVAKDELTIKLTNDLIIDLTKDPTKDRNEAHVLVSGTSKYYNAVNINKNIAIDLNGHSITVSCGSGPNDNSDVGALFFVDVGGSLNIVDRAGGGFIKMASSIYAVWAPYADPSYVDIYEGIFIADSYAGDIIGKPVDADGNYDPENGTMKNENANRALIYAGFGGKINVYGGYFLYNNTTNDNSNRNNGAFNCKDFYESSRPLITIHGGVKLINSGYRQNPANTSRPDGSFDNYSIKLALGYEISDEKVPHSLTVDGNTYDSWYQVCSYKLTYVNTDGTSESVYVGDNTQPYLLKPAGSGYRWIDKEAEEITEIPAGNTVDVSVYLDDLDVYEAIFVDKDGNRVKAVKFTTKDTELDPTEIPQVPEIEGYIGHWESYSLKDATGSIIIKPYYTVDANSGELASASMKELFAALSQGKSMVMTQGLEESQNNSSVKGACIITDSNSTDKDSVLNLNGYTLEYNFEGNGNQAWRIFNVKDGSSFALTTGFAEHGTLKMTVTTLKNDQSAVFILDSGSTLILEKGVVVEFHYQKGGTVAMFSVTGMTQEEIVANPNLLFEKTDINGMDVIKLTVLETTTIEVPKA